MMNFGNMAYKREYNWVTMAIRLRRLYEGLYRKKSDNK